MLKFIACLSLVFVLVACGSGGDNYPVEPDTNATIGDIPTDNAETDAEAEHFPHDIPRYNEYFISLRIEPSERTVQGMSHITFTNRSAVEMETIVLRVYLNAFSEGVEPSPVFSEFYWRAFPHGRDFGFMDIEYASVDNEAVDFTLDETVLTLFLPEPLAPNATIQILLQYDAFVPQIAHRTGGNDYALWFGMFLPVLAVFDEDSGWKAHAHYPAGSPFVLETANYQIEITTPIRYVVVGTGLRTEVVFGDTDTKITHFVAHQARDFAFAISPYFNHAHISTESGIDIHFYYYTESLLVDEILEMASRSMSHFEEYVGMFPLGHVTIIETELLQDSASFSQIVFVDSWYLRRRPRLWAVAHGLGNQWFANIIGTNRITEPWLTEGLTRYIQAGIFYATPEALRARMESDHASIADSTTLYLSHGLYFSPNWAHYAFSHGRKAMLMIYALHDKMGDEIFWQFISDYYQTFSFGIATVDDFVQLAEYNLGECLLDFFDLWLNYGTVPPLPERI
jgi:hypothetical protein